MIIEICDNHLYKIEIIWILKAKHNNPSPTTEKVYFIALGNMRSRIWMEKEFKVSFLYY